MYVIGEINHGVTNEGRILIAGTAIQVRDYIDNYTEQCGYTDKIPLIKCNSIEELINKLNESTAGIKVNLFNQIEMANHDLDKKEYWSKRIYDEILSDIEGFYESCNFDFKNVSVVDGELFVDIRLKVKLNQMHEEDKVNNLDKIMFKIKKSVELLIK